MKMHEIELKDPFDYDGEKIEKIILKPCKAKQVRKITADSSISELLDIAGELAGWNDKKIDELSAYDAGEVLKYVGEQLSNFQ